MTSETAAKLAPQRPDRQRIAAALQVVKGCRRATMAVCNARPAERFSF